MEIEQIIKAMTLEEKAGMCSGKDCWHTKEVNRLNVPNIMVSDGPHGLRKQSMQGDNLGVNESIQAVCFPTGCASAASFDRDLMYEMGDCLGKECQAEDVAVILGPAVNMKRSPLCGRNFEYYSEDPFLAGEMAASQINGIQKHKVGTSIKHFFANSQEQRRMSSSSEMDERTAREIYLTAFEIAIKKAKPWTVMCSYNRLNGTYLAENHTYLTDVLRGEWGFDGVVVSDWGAVNDRVPDLVAGTDLEMPSSNGTNDRKIVQAVKEGKLKEEVLDDAVRRILKLVERFTENRELNVSFDRENDHEKARQMASECMVLLKNNGILPLNASNQTAFIGEFAENPRYQGGGSSHINSSKIESALQMAKDLPVRYARGYDASQDVVKEDLIWEAVQVAQSCKNVVIFAGLPDSYESEGFDRSHMQLPECQNRLIQEVLKVNPNTVVVLHNGSPVEMPWVDDVAAILEVYLCGQAVGGALVDVLYGKVNPSGHLPETFPIKLEHNPSYLYYFGEGDKTEYREGVFVGYRYYDTKKMPVLFPFGHGLSYTTFAYSNLSVKETGKNELSVEVTVTNTGTCFGKTAVQLYVAPLHSKVIRPVHELKGFEKVGLNPSESKIITFALDSRSFAYYDMDIHNWYVEKGDYRIEIGESSRDIRCTQSIDLPGDERKKINITPDTVMADLIDIPELTEVIKKLNKIYVDNVFGTEKEDSMGISTRHMMESMGLYMPLRSVIASAYGTNLKEEADLLSSCIGKHM